MTNRMPYHVAVIHVLFGLLVLTQDVAAAEDRVDDIDEVVVIGSAGDLHQVAGSGAVIESEAMDQHDHVDLNQVVSAVPGVYVREEDGFGLRPNIGIRGASAERSQKITIMEDGMLVTPAPYSAPAAYYVPNVSRMDAVEVLKGPAAIVNGPNTVGGSINFVTRDAPSTFAGAVDVSMGNDRFYKLEGSLGNTVGDTGVLAEVLTYGSDGFKDLDTGGGTGFERREINLKLRRDFGTTVAQRAIVKLGYADEDADETYLGLADLDFDRSPNRRYGASSQARFLSERVSVEGIYGARIGDSLRVNAKGYWHAFDRGWNKLDGFFAGPALLAVLTEPTRFLSEYALLTGQADSTGSASDTFDVTNNQREYESSGAQVTMSYRWQHGLLSHDLTAAIRYHYDEVNRAHIPGGYLMRAGQLVEDGLWRPAKVLNHAESAALAAHVVDEISWRDLTVTLGARMERIRGAVDDYIEGSAVRTNQSVVAPGAGLLWRVTDRLAVLAGAYHGFSPAGPGDSGVSPEESLNLEFGVRFTGDTSDFTLIAFSSDYDNLLGRCRVSDVGCAAGDEFNGGGIDVHGAELSGSATLPLGLSELELSFAYTYTDSAFQTTFLSGFSQWGLVRKGDELPYLPRHTGRLQALVSAGRWDTSVVVKGVSEMREAPGQGSVSAALHTDGHLTLDASVRMRATEAVILQLMVQNLTNEAVIVSHRPLGARPMRPRSVVMRIKYDF